MSSIMSQKNFKIEEIMVVRGQEESVVALIEASTKALRDGETTLLFGTRRMRAKRMIIIMSLFLSLTLFIILSLSLSFLDANFDAGSIVRMLLKRWERESGGKLRHSLVSRDSLSEKDLDGKDLVVALGGDGTTLIASHWISSSTNRKNDERSAALVESGDDDAEGRRSNAASNGTSTSYSSDNRNTNNNNNIAPKLIGINTDPAVLAPCLTFTKKAEDERRSTGWLCAADANDMEDVLREILFASSDATSPRNENFRDTRESDGGSLKRRPIRANRIRVKVNGKTWKTMPLALNDVLICHNSPAALSRYSVLLEEDDLVSTPPSPLSSSSSSSSPSSSCDDTNHGGNSDGDDTKKKKKFEAYYHIRSSGLRLCTALGATAAMKSAGGFAMSRDDRRIQFHDREPIYYDHEPKPPGRGRGFYPANKTTKFRWNTRVGKIYVDGAHVCHSVRIGDEIEVESAEGDELEIYTKNFRNIALT